MIGNNKKQQQKECKVKCCVCSNVMAASSFLKHKETKHSLLLNVAYIKLIELDDDQQSSNATHKNETPIMTMVKCKYCPNKIPSDGMERHLLRSHIECNDCGLMVMKSNLDRHMEQKHCATVSDSPPLQLPSPSKHFVDAPQLLPVQDPQPQLMPVPEPQPQLIPVPEPQRKPEVPNIIYVNEFEMGSLIRQNRVIKKEDGFLYLRNVDHF